MGMHRFSVLSCVLLMACTPLAPGGDVLRDAGVMDGSQDPSDEDGSAPGDDGEVTEPDAVTPCPPLAAREKRRFERAELTEDSHWSCRYDYEIEGHLVVSKGTLQIDPGVRVLAERGAFLLVGSAARLVAVGTPEQPIVFTAAQRPAKPGAFRGLFMLGLADTSLPNSATLGLPAGDARAVYGGGDDDHDCGELRYVRIEFAGGPANEYDFPAAGLTLAGCGRKTRVESVQVHAATDGIGLIGGTVPLKRVLVSAPSADGIEWTAGYRGLLQFAVVQMFYGAGAALKGSGSLADPAAVPLSAPFVYNATLVGALSQGLKDGPVDPNGFETGMLLQAGSGAVILNSLLFGFAGSWFDVVGERTAQLFRTDSQVASTIFADSEPRRSPGFPSGGIEPGDGEDDDANFSEDMRLRDTNLANRFFEGVLNLRAPFARPPERPDFSADGLVDGGNLRDSAPPGWADLWEPAFYAGAFPKIQFESERSSDWTASSPGEDADEKWTSFPSD